MLPVLEHTYSTIAIEANGSVIIFAFFWCYGMHSVLEELGQLFVHLIRQLMRSTYFRKV